MNSLLTWLDRRTGYQHLLNEALFEAVPGGARWRYVWGSTLVFTFVVQLITGTFLWMAYSPSDQTAWESVFFISYLMQGGWFLRGLHHFTAQAMVVLLAVHLMQVIIDGAYKAPREINFWTGLILMQIVLGLSLTGYLLPWDQKGYWATKVATTLAALIPIIGVEVQKLAVGGTAYGHLTLTRFFALHAGVLPALLIGMLVVHIYVFRFHGIHAVKDRFSRADCKFWPDQVYKDAVACLGVLLAVVFLTIYFGGAELGAPADPSNAYSAARPEWYFLFLFQFLKYFPGPLEPLGALVIPGAVMVILFLMPLWGSSKWGHRLNVFLIFFLIGGAGLLTYEALVEDKGGYSLIETKAKPPNYDYLAAVKRGHELAEVYIHEAEKNLIPKGGVTELVRDNLTIHGPTLFARNCGICHRVNEHNGEYIMPTLPGNAADLAGFASLPWLEGLLDPKQIDSLKFFGGTNRLKKGEMVDFVKTVVAEYSDEQKAELKLALLALTAEAELPGQAKLVAENSDKIAKGRLLLQGKAGDLGCADCHNFHGSNKDATAPDLTGYGSRPWMIDLVHDVTSDRFYPGEQNEGMPLFGAKEQLTPHQIGLIVDWLRTVKMGPPPFPSAIKTAAPAAAATPAGTSEPTATAEPTAAATPAATVEPTPAATSEPAAAEKPATPPAAETPVTPPAGETPATPPAAGNPPSEDKSAEGSAATAPE